MKKSVIIASILFLASFSAHASYDEIGTIKSVHPIQSEQFHTTQVCDGAIVNQVQQTSSDKTGAIIGGIAGALLGNQVGGGSGRYVMTAIGAATGALTGDRLNRMQPGSTNAMAPQQQCRLVQVSTPRVSGYLVSYEVLGRTYQSTFPYDPSQGGTNANIRVSISVTPR